MIIVMNLEPINQSAVKAIKNSHDSDWQAYHKLDLSKATSETIYIVDLTADGSFQKLASPEKIAKNLCEAGLLKAVKVIQLIVSDIDPKKSLLEFGANLSEALESRGYNIKVNVPTQLEYDSVLVCPPLNETTGYWQIFEIDHGEYQAFLYNGNQPTHDALKNFSKNKLLWSGKDINEFMSKLNETKNLENSL